MKVLSLFDGISCGRVALERAGIKVEKYYASEIKKNAIKVSKFNYPDIIHIGDVNDVDFIKYNDVDLLIGGSPCQDFSRGNKERLGLKGNKSSLFYKFLEAKKIINPKYFLLENVVMSLDDNIFISKSLGVEPVNINSSLVSGQLRDRFYWTNITGNSGLFGNMIKQPDDKNIKLEDVLENGYCPLSKSRCLLESDSRPLSTPVKMFHRFYSTGFTTLVFKTIEHYFSCKKHYDKYYKGLSTDNFNLDNSVYGGVRYLTSNELEELQTLKKGYCRILKRNETACLCGDGWNIDTIAHICRGLK